VCQTALYRAHISLQNDNIIFMQTIHLEIRPQNGFEDNVHVPSSNSRGSCIESKVY